MEEISIIPIPVWIQACVIVLFLVLIAMLAGFVRWVLIYESKREDKWMKWMEKQNGAQVAATNKLSECVDTGFKDLSGQLTEHEKASSIRGNTAAVIASQRGRD